MSIRRLFATFVRVLFPIFKMTSHHQCGDCRAGPFSRHCAWLCLFVASCFHAQPLNQKAAAKFKDNSPAPVVVRYESDMPSGDLHLHSVVAGLNGSPVSAFKELAPGGHHRVDVEATFSQDTWLGFGYEDAPPFASFHQHWEVDLTEPRHIVVVLKAKERSKAEGRERLSVTASIEVVEPLTGPPTTPTPEPLRFRVTPQPSLPPSLLKVGVDFFHIVRM